MSRMDCASARRRAAFTLIELLVVVAIIALLLSILLPSLERARAQARQVLCLTNLKSQGRAVFFYAEDNDGFIGRGLMGFRRRGNKVFNIYVTTVIKYLGYNEDPLALWDGGGGGVGPSPQQQRKLRRVLSKFGEQLQCPDFPDEKHDPVRQESVRVTTSYLDYVASTMPIPQTVANIDYDLAGGGRGGDHYNAEGGVPDYLGVSKFSDITDVVNPGRLVFVTEAHRNMLWDDFTFHHFFLASQLPFAGFPRIASDQRHPGGITGMFFDGHAVPLPLKRVDPGWPSSLGLRLSLFTLVPEGFE